MWGTARITALSGALAVLALAAPAAQAASCADADLLPARGNLDRVEAATLCLLNQERVAHELAPLRRSSKLDGSAAYHDAEMVHYRFLAETAPGRSTVLDRIRAYGYFKGVRSGLYAENVGAGATSNGTPHALVDAWMASAGHRANILYARFRDIGIAATLAPPDPAFFAGFQSTVYTTDFGRRLRKRHCVHSSGRTATSRRRLCRRR